MLTNNKPIITQLRRLLEDPDLRDLSNELQAALDIVGTFLSQDSFDDLIDRFSTGQPLPGVASRGHPINIIPSKGPSAACQPTLLALSRGRGKRGTASFDNVMKGVKEHLIRCHGIVKIVLVVTDTWDSRNFLENHHAELAAWHRKGVRCIFLGIGAPRHEISRIAVNLK